LAGALSFYEKIRQSAALFWFGLRNEHMQTVNQTSRRIGGLLHGAAQNFEVVLNIQDQK
jgi:hypothetical protein